MTSASIGCERRIKYGDGWVIFVSSLESRNWYRHTSQDVVNHVGTDLQVRIGDIDYVVGAHRDVRILSFGNLVQIDWNRHLVASRVTANQRCLTWRGRIHRTARRSHCAKHGQPGTDHEESRLVDPSGDHYVA